MSADALAQELASAVCRCAGHKRLRLAVSPEEYTELREHFLQTQKYFSGTIMGIPLLIEAMPPAAFVEERAEG